MQIRLLPSQALRHHVGADDFLNATRPADDSVCNWVELVINLGSSCSCMLGHAIKCCVVFVSVLSPAPVRDNIIIIAITHYKTESVHFWWPMTSATKMIENPLRVWGQCINYLGTWSLTGPKPESQIKSP